MMERYVQVFQYSSEEMGHYFCLHSPVYYLLKDMVKDTDKQPDEEQRKFLSRGASIPAEWGYAALAHGCVYQLRRSLNPILWGFLWKLHHIGLMNY